MILRTLWGEKMTGQEFVKSMTFLAKAYRQEIDETQVGVWYNFFRDVPLEKFNMAIVRIIEKDRYFPTVATIRQELASIENPHLQLDASEEWEKVLEGIQYHGAYGANKAVAELNPVTAAVVKRIGGFSELCRCEDIEWKRKSFMSVFKETLDRHKEIASYSASQLTESERKRHELVSSTLKLLEKK